MHAIKIRLLYKLLNFGSTDQICHYGLYCCNLVLDLFLFDAPHTSLKINMHNK